MHGRGLFALQPLATSYSVIEYKGELTSWPRTALRQRSETGHMFAFGL
ncbi:nuclear protein SET [Paraburkholderia sp. CNPSo 3155]|nr:nuclear protein SET [Paraburkholderia atlantica]NUY35946.1 nuclear protein SET [Paraburkholderia atlantica]